MRLEYFQLVDRIVELSRAERTIVVSAVVPAESTVFEGHFPGYPLMPGVLLIETMAQTSGWLLIAENRFERMPFLAQVKEAKLRTFVRPGAALTVTASLLHDGSGFAVTRAKITQDGKAVSEAELTFRITPFPSPELSEQMQDLGRRIGFPFEAVMADANG